MMLLFAVGMLAGPVVGERGVLTLVVLGLLVGFAGLVLSLWQPEGLRPRWQKELKAQPAMTPPVSTGPPGDQDRAFPKESAAEEDLVVHERPTLGALTVVVAVLFLVASAWLLSVPPRAAANAAFSPLQMVVGAGGVALRAGALVLGVRGLLRPRVLLRADERGVLVDGYPLLPWSDITSVEVIPVPYARGRQLLLRLSEGRTAPSPRGGVVAPLLHGLGRSVHWGPDAVPVRADSGVPPDELRGLLREKRWQTRG